MKKKLLSIIGLGLAFIANAQYVSNLSSTSATISLPETQSLYIGVGGGIHTSFMSISDIDDDIFPTKKNATSGVFSVFLRKTFGDQLQYGIRPELSFLKRGGKITEIYSNVPGYYKDNELKDVVYSVSPSYIDLRVPLMYRLGDLASSVRPYVYVAPVFGFCSGGHIRTYEVGEVYDERGKVMDEINAFDGLNLKATKANMSSMYLAGSLGVGADFAIEMAHRCCYVGIEAAYEYGFSNTYGNDSEAKYQIPLNGASGEIKGSRKFSGLEFKLTLGIPLGSPHAPVAPVVYVEPDPIVEYVEVVEDEENIKPCYTLDEIIALMQNGVSVKGKTICAIDDAINFDFGKSNIKRESYDYLNRLAETLKRTNSHVIIKGHTDNVGTEEFNLTLSKNRAVAVYNYLIKRGVPSSYLEYEYYGMSQPITSNDTEEGRRLNRRVEFEIKN